MRKIYSVLILVAVLLSFCSCTENRKNVLKIYNWSCYIADGVLDEFQKWYKENTGEDIEIVYQTFDINETMLTKIEKGHEDFDVICPSEYIIERMLNNELLLPLDFGSIPDSLNYIEQNRSPFITGLLKMPCSNHNANDYFVPYMWGTAGILYNTDDVPLEDASTWKILQNTKYSGKIFIKDAPKDVFSPILIYLKQKELAEGSVTIDELMRSTSDENIAAVEDFMKDVTPLVAGWEADFGKEQMTQGLASISLNWSGDAAWAMAEGKKVGTHLDYVIPKEGSIVWFDGWVIPKYAKNTKAATWFINFMCRPDIAIRNMDECGYVSANNNIAVLESQIDDSFGPIDISYFFGENADSVHVNPVTYPDKSIIDRCTIMHDWGQDSDKLISMWSRVKGQNANATTIIVIVVALITGIFTGFYSKRKKYRAKKSR